MAMSFARPDPSSPASVADAAFGTSRRGFDQNEVTDFLRMVAAEMGRLQERERFLERELRTAQTNPDLDNVRFDDATLTRLLGEETARVLTTAREAATEIREKAEQNAARLLSEASDEALRMREEAEVEASRRRSDASSDAEAELAMAKQQGREMVNEARAYRERVLSELARRRELAREQIEQLMHGRDRLMQAFERARVVAVDVVAELKPLGEPDEYVNLSPTTGPVPVMVPNSRRPDERHAGLEVVRTPTSNPKPTFPMRRPTPRCSSRRRARTEFLRSRSSTTPATSPSRARVRRRRRRRRRRHRRGGHRGLGSDGEVSDGEHVRCGRRGSRPRPNRTQSPTATATTTSRPPPTASTTDDEHDDGEHDDVVVDLFARLRAESRRRRLDRPPRRAGRRQLADDQPASTTDHRMPRRPSADEIDGAVGSKAIRPFVAATPN